MIQYYYDQFISGTNIELFTLTAREIHIAVSNKQ